MGAKRPFRGLGAGAGFARALAQKAQQRPSEPAGTLKFVPRQPPAFRAFTGTTPPKFVNEVELECAKMLDFYGVPWEYEPRTFVLEQDENGRVTRAFTPDFYLPEQDLYV